MREYVTGGDMAKMANTRGEVMESHGNLTMVKTLLDTRYVYTVWDCESGFQFTNTFYEDEAKATYNKYKNFRGSN